MLSDRRAYAVEEAGRDPGSSTDAAEPASIKDGELDADDANAANDADRSEAIQPSSFQDFFGGLMAAINHLKTKLT